MDIGRSNIAGLESLPQNWFLYHTVQSKKKKLLKIKNYTLTIHSFLNAVLKCLG